MSHRMERPVTRPERYVTIAAIVAALLTGDWLLLPILREPSAIHTGRFVTLAALLGLISYLIWLLMALSTVRYVLSEESLLLRQLHSRLEIDLSAEDVQLFRWRSRWTWSGWLSRDLGVEEMAMMPPLWLWRGASIWVIRWSHPNGLWCAAAIRPSPALLAVLRDRVRKSA